MVHFFVQLRYRIRRLLEHRIIAGFIFSIVILNILVLILETEASIQPHFSSLFYGLTIFFLSIFCIEYAMRLFSLDNFRHLFSPLMVLDLLAILSMFFLAAPLNFPFLWFIRMIRIFQILKLARYTHSLKHLYRVFHHAKDDLVVAMGIWLIIMVVAAFFMHYIEVDTEAFSSVPRALWWAFITFTTIGYGDSIPQTGLGRIVAVIFSFVGVMFYCLMTSIVTSSFLAVTRRPV